MPPFPSAPATETPIWGRWGTRVLDLLLPPHCAACGAPVSAQGTLCAGCFAGLSPVVAPYCDGCGLPFAAADLADTSGRCSACVNHPPAFGRGRAAFSYDGTARAMVLAFKHAGRAGLARVLAPHMARVGGDLLADGPLLIPVPLHRWRLFWRGYNQAALLARELGGLTGCPTAPDALRRVRMTRSLGRLGAEERRAVVAGVFAVRRARSALVAGRAVVLIDDVMTSGATLDGCARVLLACGAARVDALVAARVPLSRSD